MRYSVPLAAAREAVRPTPLADVLESLKRAGAIESYRVEGDELAVEADTAAEVAALFREAAIGPMAPGTFHTPPAPPANRMSQVGADTDEVCRGITTARRAEFVRARDARATYVRASAEYYAQVRAFTHARAFQKLSKQRRNIWRLHAEGFTQREAAFLLGCSQSAVERAIIFVRPLAGLRRTSRTISRGQGRKKTRGS